MGCVGVRVKSFVLLVPVFWRLVLGSERDPDAPTKLACPKLVWKWRNGEYNPFKRGGHVGFHVSLGEGACLPSREKW